MELADPWLETMHDIGASNREMFGAKARDVYLGNEAGVDASRLKPSMREYAQLSKIKGELGVGDDPEALRGAIQTKIDAWKADPRYSSDNLFKPGDDAGLHLRVREYEGALKELGTGNAGETFTRRWEDEQGRWQEETRLTYASRYNAAQQLKQKDPARAQKLEDYTASLMMTAPGIGAETSKDRISDEIIKERAATQQEFEKLKNMAADERRAYLETNANFLKEAGIPRHSAMSAALLTYDNIIEKAAALGQRMTQLGLKHEADHAKVATINYEQELLGRLEKEGKIAFYKLDIAHDAVSLNRTSQATDADRLALAHLTMQKQARGMGKIEFFEAPLSEQQVKDIRQELSTARYLNGKAAFEQLLESRRKMPGLRKSLFTPEGAPAHKPARDEPEHVIDMLNESSNPAPLLAALMRQGNAQVLERVAQYYGTSRAKLKEAGIQIHSDQPETQAKVREVVEKAFHDGRLAARFENTLATPLTGERRQVFVIEGTREEIKAFSDAMQTMNIRHKFDGIAALGTHQISVDAGSLKAWLPQGVTFDALRPHQSVREMKAEYEMQATRYEKEAGKKAERPNEGEFFKALLKRLDKDGDGKLTAKDIDINRDGRLSKGEEALLLDAYHALKGSLSAEARAALTVIHDLAAKSGIRLDPVPISGVTAGASGAAVEEPNRHR